MMSCMKPYKLLAYGGFALLVVISIATVVLIFLPVPAKSSDPAEALTDVTMLADAITIAAVGVVIGVKLPRNPIGWILLAVGLVLATQSFLNIFTLIAFWTGTNAVWGGMATAWLANWIWVFPFLGILFLLQLFPTGTFLSRRWRWATLAFLTLYAVIATAMALSSQIQVVTQQGPLLIHSPVALLVFPDWIYPWLFQPFVVCVLFAISGMIWRFVQSRGVERQQMKWFVYAAVVFVAAIVFSYYIKPLIYQVFVNILALGLPISIGVAILRYRLYDIDIIIRKTLLYSVLTGVLVAVYFGSVTVLTSLFSRVTREHSALAIVASTLLIAALFTPLRRRLQDVTDRRFYRKKYDAQQVLAQFALTARDETDLDALTAELVRVAQETMQPKSVSVWIRRSMVEKHR